MSQQALQPQDVARLAHLPLAEVKKYFSDRDLFVPKPLTFGSKLSPLLAFVVDLHPTFSTQMQSTSNHELRIIFVYYRIPLFPGSRCGLCDHHEHSPARCGPRRTAQRPPEHENN
jgi:hypothetical protein